MPVTNTSVVNLPVAALWLMAIALVVFALSSLCVAVAAIKLLGALVQVANNLNKITGQVHEALPGLLHKFGNRLKSDL